jgi:mannose-1-phosphate guanylyltransferase
MAGGSGTRFWPASRNHRPKQFLNIFGSKTMLDQTLERVKPICREENVIIVGSAGHHELLTESVGENRFVVMEEPFGRNTAPCIGLAAVYLRKRGALDDPMVVLPADHFIADEKKFRDVLLAGCRLACDGPIVTVGMMPTRPETGYGYLKRGSVQREVQGVPTYNVERFVEKPEQRDAVRYLESGDYFWNGGIFIFTPKTILAEMETHLPDVFEGLGRVEASLGERSYPEVLRAAYENFPSISLDYGIMEKTARSVLAIAGDFGWSDVGSWESLYALRDQEQDGAGNLTQGTSILIDSSSSFVFNQSEHLIVGLGLEGMVIVGTGDAVLVADLKKSQDVRKVIEEIKAGGLDSLL